MLWLGKPDVQVTWEPASSLPVAAIQEFEKGLMPKIVQHTSDHYGHGTSTIAVQEDTCESPPTKKPRPDRPVVESSIG